MTETPVGFLLERLISAKAEEADVAAVLVPKVGFDEWWEKVSTSEEDLRAVVAPAVLEDSSYTLPREFNANSVPDSWDTSMSNGAVHGRSNHCAVWTGTEMIVWGGIWDDYMTRVYTNSGGRYNPATDTWVPLPVTDKTPVGRCNATAVWTGSEMLVWGGYWTDASGVVHLENSGGRFNANSGAWSALPVSGAPEARTSHTAIWTGKEMIVWGGCQGSEFPLASGGRFNPKTGKWKTTTAKNAPVPRERHCAVWTGTEMIVWGGYRWDGADHVENTGGRYDPKKNKWIPTASDASAPEARYSAAAVWTGTEMIVFGGYVPNGFEWDTTQSGGRYTPASNTWQRTNQQNSPPGVGMASCVWTGTEMLVWGGEAGGGTWSTGGRYNPVSDSWVVFPWGRTDLPESRYLHSTVWTGKEMIVWGGYSVDGETGATDGFLSSGARYAPATDSWVPIRFGGNVPQGTSDCSTLWTGTELIVWGGWSLEKTFNTGGAYSFATASWRGLANAGAPAGRFGHSAVWTGTEMLVWGGWPGGSQGFFKDGGRYNPDADTWIAIPASAEAPSGRYYGTAVWTGTEMIIWGGTGEEAAGGRWNPQTGIWSPMATAGAPKHRFGAFGGWNGHDVLIWGGADSPPHYGGNISNDGALYDPSNDTWRPAAASPGVLPSVAKFGLAWSGKELFIWGGQIGYTPSGEGWIFNSESNAWESMPTDPATPCPRAEPSSAWTGDGLLVCAGVDPSNDTGYQDGAIFKPASGHWTTIANGGPMGARGTLAGDRVVWWMDPWQHQRSYYPYIGMGLAYILGTGVLKAESSSNQPYSYLGIVSSFQASASGGQPPYEYLWDFGDGSGTTVGPTPDHSFNMAGTYPVTLSVKDASGASAAAPAFSYCVREFIRADAAASAYYGKAPLSVTFTGTASGGAPPLSPTWDFGDGTGASGLTGAHTYTTKGTYYWKFTVLDGRWNYIIKGGSILVNAGSAEVNTPPSSRSIAGQPPPP